MAGIQVFTRKLFFFCQHRWKQGNTRLEKYKVFLYSFTNSSAFFSSMWRSILVKGCFLCVFEAWQQWAWKGKDNPTTALHSLNSLSSPLKVKHTVSLWGIDLSRPTPPRTTFLLPARSCPAPGLISPQLHLRRPFPPSPHHETDPHPPPKGCSLTPSVIDSQIQ